MDILDRLIAHNEWATRELIERCGKLSSEEYHREMEIGLCTLHKTCAHIVGVMFVWGNMIATDSPGEVRDLSKVCAGPEELLQELSKAHSCLTDAASGVRSENRLDEILEQVHPRTKMRYRCTRGSMITHVLTHGMHHRAQVLQMLRQLGETELPDVDVLEWEIMESVGSREPA